jgi:hypothetical protein
MGDHLPRFADAGFQRAPRYFENKQFGALEKLSSVGQSWIEQHEITGFQYGLAAVLLQSEPSRDLPADKDFIGVRMRDMAHIMRDGHWRVVEKDETDVGEASRLKLGSEGLPALRTGIVIDECLAGDGMPATETITWAN